MKTKTVYKVVRSDNGCFTSAVHKMNNSGQKYLPYAIDTLTRPPLGCNPFLWVFDTPRHARNFILEMTANWSNQLTFKVLRGIGLNVRFRAYTINKRRKDSRYIKYKGTMFCDAFLALKDVT